MNAQTAGLLFNLYCIMRRYNRVLASTGNHRLADKAAWHTYGLIYLAGWAFVGTGLFGFLSIFWAGWLVPLCVCVALIPVWLYAVARDREWEAALNAQAIEPPPIPEDYRPVTAPEPATQQVLTAFYRPPAKRIRSAR